jgi:hypothetical protein
VNESRQKNWLVMAVLTGACAAWQIYDLATEVEAQNQAVEALRYFGLSLALLACIGSSALYIKSLSNK